MYYAHTLPHVSEQQWQSLEDHLTNVAERAANFAKAFGAEQWGELVGLLHDVGKSSREFQNRLHGKKLSVDHASAGAQFLWHYWEKYEKDIPSHIRKAYSTIFAYCIAGHHSGLPDYGASACDTGTLIERLAKTLAPYDTTLPYIHIPSIQTLGTLPIYSVQCTEQEIPFRIAFFIRMLYSCLTDADALDTEAFCNPEQARLRRPCPSLAALADILHDALIQKHYLTACPVENALLRRAAQAPCGTDKRKIGIISARQNILHACLCAAKQPQGIFSLTVPTGGGKTLSSLAFALEHARRHGLSRIVLVVPYTSIIEQNAQEIRTILRAEGADTVLEHHCNYLHTDLENSEDAESNAAKEYRLRIENWDAAIIVTTAVQFFESLFASRSSQCRKLHNIAQSVVVLDEAQMLPLNLLHASVQALKELLLYNTSIVLCTATQPALLAPQLSFGFADVLEIIPQELLESIFPLFERSALQDCGKLSDEALARRLRAEKQVLCIVNSRNKAATLFDLIDDTENSFHLSARMTPQHRSSVIQEIRHCLAAKQCCRVVSTSLIECGVDISFPTVYREEAGLDTIAQSAGRCNRSGEFTNGQVFIFSAEQGLPRKAADLQRRVTVFRRCKNETSPFSPQTVQQYFNDLYALSDLDESRILQNFDMDSLARFPFRKVAQDFIFINNTTYTIIIENDASREYIEQLENFEPISRTTLRLLQRHSVSVYPHEFKKLVQDGRLECLREHFYIARGALGYSSKKGLEIELAQGYDPNSFLL